MAHFHDAVFQFKRGFWDQFRTKIFPFPVPLSKFDKVFEVKI